MKLTLGFSPCPNDTFIFDAMVHGKIDTESLEFDYFLADVEELNRRAFKTEVDITKLSSHAFAYAAKDYLIMDSGSALGFSNGPLLISKRKMDLSELNKATIAIPGRYTTANLLFSIVWPEAVNKKEFLFSDIENALLSGEADAGLIIHETRFTYREKGLVKIADMGEYWDKITGLPIPLGNIVISRSIPTDVAMKVNNVIRRSIEFASANRDSAVEFIKANAREIRKSVINEHIKLYVNDFTYQLGWQGRKALRELFRIASEKRIIPPVPENIFLT
jgi:1,4-dihydroxy-6-naphthoate synthase